MPRAVRCGPRLRYDRPDLLADSPRGKVGEDAGVGVENTPPGRSFSLPAGCERDLRAFLAPEYEIYERAIGGPEPKLIG